MSRPDLSVVVPATGPAPFLEHVTAAVRAAMREGDELLVVREPVRTSPAHARNLGALEATKDVLVFVDADVVVHRDALDRLRDALAADPGLCAAFGAYDDDPPGGVVARFRNLLHHHVHRSAAGPARTFWAGLGAVRRQVFLQAGGFDDRRYPRPMLEDVELGLRLTDEGERILLLPEASGKHLKVWSLRQMVRSDLLDRGVPWTRLLLERRQAPAVLNLGWRHRASAGSVLLAPPLALAGVWPAVLATAVTFLALNHAFHRLLLERLGAAGATAGVGLHALHLLISVLALAVGTVAHVVRPYRAAAPYATGTEPAISRTSGARASRATTTSHR